MNTHSPWVAIVDDDEAIRRALLRLMRSAGVAARGFACGAEFLAAQRQAGPRQLCRGMRSPRRAPRRATTSELDWEAF